MLAGEVIRHDTFAPLHRDRLTNCKKPFVANLRERDKRELDEIGVPRDVVADVLVRGHVVGAIFPHQWMPAAAVAFHPITARCVSASLLATDDWSKVARRVVRWGLRVAKPKLLSMGFTRAECRVMDGHADAIRLLSHLGFQRECVLPNYGASGVTFHQFAWRYENHVFA